MDENSYEGGENGDFHPISWYQEYDGGRSWYTNLGHRDETFQDEKFLKHLLAGIEYAIGENFQLDYNRARTMRKPEDNRFVMTVLDEYLNEPMELVVLPNLNVLYTQRMEDAFFTSVGIATDKAFTAAAVKKGTHVLTDKVKPEQDLFGLNLTNNGRIVTFGGGLPIVVEGEVIGGVGVSGGSVDEDIAVAEAALSVLEV